MVKSYNNYVVGVLNMEVRENVIEKIFEELLVVYFFKVMKYIKLEIRKGLWILNIIINYQVYFGKFVEIRRLIKYFKSSYSEKVVCYF